MVKIDNVAEAKYGTKHWDAYVILPFLFSDLMKGFYREMSIKNGDDDIIWGRE